MLLEELNSVDICILCSQKLETKLFITNKDYSTFEYSLINDFYPLKFRLSTCFTEPMEYIIIFDKDIIMDYNNVIRGMNIKKICTNHYAFNPKITITLENGSKCTSFTIVNQEEILYIDGITIVNNNDSTLIFQSPFDFSLKIPKQKLDYFPIHNKTELKAKIEKLKLLK